MSSSTLSTRAATAPNGERRTTPFRWNNIGVYAIAFLLCSAIIAPVAYIIIGGFRTNSQITVSPAGWPRNAR